jgi:hypothetical protein
MRGEKTADLAATLKLKSFTGLLRPACCTENACCNGDRMLITPPHATMLLFGADRRHEVQGLRVRRFQFDLPFLGMFSCAPGF